MSMDSTASDLALVSEETSHPGESASTQIQIGARSSINVTCARSISELSNETLQLLDESGEASFMFSRAWFEILEATTLANNKELRIYVAERVESNEPLVVFFARTPAGQDGSIYEDAGASKHSLASFTNYQTLRYRIIENPDVDCSGAYRSLAHVLTAERPALSLIDLSYLERASQSVERFSAALREQGWAVRSYTHAKMLYETENLDSWDEFLGAKSKNFRKQTRNRENRLERNYDTSFQIYTNANERLEQALQDYDQVDRASWKDAENYPDFVPTLARRAAEDGALRLGILKLDGRPAAAELWLVSDGVASGLKGHYDPEFQSDNVGQVAMTKMLRHLMDFEGIREFDLGHGVSDYKTHWTTKERELHGMTAFNQKTSNGALMLTRRIAGETYSGLRAAAKRVLKR